MRTASISIRQPMGWAPGASQSAGASEVYEISDAEWATTIMQRVIGFRHLPAGWDGKNGGPISKPIVDVAIDSIVASAPVATPIPCVMPVIGGGIQFEWDVGSKSVELEVLPDGTMDFLVSDDTSDFEESGHLSPNDTASIRRLLTWVTR